MTTKQNKVSVRRFAVQGSRLALANSLKQGRLASLLERERLETTKIVNRVIHKISTSN